MPVRLICTRCFPQPGSRQQADGQCQLQTGLTAPAQINAQQYQQIAVQLSAVQPATRFCGIFGIQFQQQLAVDVGAGTPQQRSRFQADA